MKNINFKSIKGETRQGASSFVMVMFFTMLLGIIMVGFISIMLSNIMSSTNYDLSQSAYDSSLAGIEDAKIMLLKFNNCAAHSSPSLADCERINNVLKASKSGEDCNVVGKALGRIDVNDNDIYETPIQSTYSGTGGTSNKAKDFANSLDQAYTCVKVDTSVDEYLGTITKDSDFKVIPLRTKFTSNNTDASPVKYIEISWFNNEDYQKAKQQYNHTSANNALAGSLNKRLGGNVTTRFTSNPTYASSLQIGLFQSAVGGYTISSFEKSINTSTNRGLMVLRPYESGNSQTQTVIPNTATTSGFAASAISGSEDWGQNLQAQNSPAEIHCSNTTDPNTFATQEFACRAIIELPTAIGTRSTWGGSSLVAGRPAADIMRYITLSSVYENIDTSFSIKMYGNADGKNCTFNVNTGKGTNCEIKQFAGVQSRVDSTGRANDLFRRVEARVELIDVNYPFPKYALSTYCEGENCNGDEGKVIKNYWVSSNCFTLINGDNRGCGADLSKNQNFIGNATAGF